MNMSEFDNNPRADAMPSATPEQLLADLQSLHRKPFPPGRRDKEFDVRTANDLASAGLTFEPGPASIQQLDGVVRSLGREVLACQPQEMQNRLADRLAFG